MNNSWLQETLELVHEWEKDRVILVAKIEELEEKISELDDEAVEIDSKIETAHALIQEYKEKHNIVTIPTLTNEFANKSYPEMLIEIAQKTGGYLKVSNAVDFMLQLGISKDRRTIQANVYSALRRMDKRFKKMKPGEYRFLNHIGGESNGKPSGIRQAVKELKEKYPQMTKNAVLSYLIKSGFDFKGKKPINAVNITWAYLGYSKEGKQQSLLGVH